MERLREMLVRKQLNYPEDWEIENILGNVKREAYAKVFFQARTYTIVYIILLLKTSVAASS